ncbi:MAG: protein-glutamate O-methyltransferase CheR [Polyangiaceae bacterium]
MSGSTSSADELDPESFALLASVIEKASGIEFGEDARTALARRLAPRVSAVSVNSLKEYAALLASLPAFHAEVQALVELVSIKETYFMRETQQIDAFIAEVRGTPYGSTRGGSRRLEVGADPADRVGSHSSGPMPELRRLAIWCAGCSTGEEPFSIAIQLAEALIDLTKVRIYASDISKKSIEFARRGTYGPSAFRAVSPELRAKYFMRGPEGDLVREAIRNTTRFGHGNLLEPGHVIGQMDAIFCRNVLIYFSQAARRKAVEIFYETLAPGGVLCLGHSESLLNADTPFEALSTPAGILYKKRRRAST